MTRIRKDEQRIPVKHKSLIESLIFGKPVRIDNGYNYRTLSKRSNGAVRILRDTKGEQYLVPFGEIKPVGEYGDYLKVRFRPPTL